MMNIVQIGLKPYLRWYLVENRLYSCQRLAGAVSMEIAPGLHVKVLYD